MRATLRTTLSNVFNSRLNLDPDTYSKLTGHDLLDVLNVYRRKQAARLATNCNQGERERRVRVYSSRADLSWLTVQLAGKGITNVDDQDLPVSLACKDRVWAS